MSVPQQNITVEGREGVGVHLPGAEPGANANAVSEAISREKSPEFLPDKYDRKLIKMGLAQIPVNVVMRSVPAKRTKSMRFGFFSIDLRQDMSTLTEAVTVPTTDETQIGDGMDTALGRDGRTVKIKVANARIFDVTDQIRFEGVNGVAKKGDTYVTLTGMSVNALVRKTDYTTNELEIQFINANKAEVIALNTKIYILGHAAAEMDGSTVPYSAIPTKTTQYMQKFMTQTLISNIVKESEKAVEYSEDDIDEMALQQLMVDIEKQYIFGAMGYSYDAQARQYTYTCSGIIEQMIKGGSHMLHITKSTFSEKDLISNVSKFFTKNSGSSTRYMFSGNGFSTAMYTLGGVTRFQNANDIETKFEYEWRRIRIGSYVVKNVAHPLFDQTDTYFNAAMIIDKQYLEIHKFRSLEEQQLALKESGVDASAKVLCEISAPCLKYPKCHGMIFLD